MEINTNTLNNPETNVEKVLKEHLDSSRWLVSSGAFERHGEICETIRSSVNFSARIRIASSRSLNTTSQKWRYTCTDTPYNQLESDLSEEPFSEKTNFKFFDTSTEQKIECAACSKSGEMQCYGCNGNGRQKCRNCDGSKFEIVSEPCPKCGDHDEDTDCSKCEGTRKLDKEVPCSKCDGKGHTTCYECRGSGVVDCNNCDGNGFQWEFELATFDLQRNVRMEEKPSWWGGYTDEFVDEIELNGRKVRKKHVGNNIVEFETSEYRVIFVKLKFGEKSYHAAIVYLSSEPAVVWDSKTSNPRTSLRRKIFDIKHRIF